MYLQEICDDDDEQCMCGIYRINKTFSNQAMERTNEKKKEEEQPDNCWFIALCNLLIIIIAAVAAAAAAAAMHEFLWRHQCKV